MLNKKRSKNTQLLPLLPHTTRRSLFVGIPEEVNNCVEFYAKCAEAKLLGGLQQNVLITVFPTDNDDRVLCPVV